MAEDRMAVLDTLRKAIAGGDVDFLREGVRVLAQAVMEAEVTELTGRAKGERDPGRSPDPPQRLPGPPAGTRGSARSSSPSRGFATARTSRACSTRVDGPSEPCSRWFARHMWQASHPAGRRPRPQPRDRRDQQERGEPDVRGPRRRGRGVPDPLARRASDTRTCGSTRRTSRCARRVGSCRWRPSSRPGSPAPASGASWAWSSAPATTRGAPGPASSAGSSSAASPACSRHLRRPRGARESRPRAAPGLRLAALPRPLHAQRPGPRPRSRPEHGRVARSARSSSSPTGPPPGPSSTG